MGQRVFFILIVFVAAQCMSVDLSCKEIKEFVNGHNSKRLLLAKGELRNQPPASQMNMMMWDPELQAKATKWVVKHLNYHNPDETVPSGRFSTGENLYSEWTTDRNYVFQPQRAIDSWFSEHVNFTFEPMRNSHFDTSKDFQIGHYTQMVWSDSVYVGCAVAKTSQDGWLQHLVACNYGPAGNYLGETPYRTDGEPANKLSCGVNDCRKLYGPSCYDDDY